jgi:hypothetical protein
MNPLDSNPNSNTNLSKMKDDSIDESETNKFKDLFGNCETIIIPRSSQNGEFAKKEKEGVVPEEIVSQQEHYLRVAKSIN